MATLKTWLMTRSNAPAASSSRGPQLQRISSSSGPSAERQAPSRVGVTILTNPARTRTRSVPPVHEGETHSSSICRSSPPSSALPRYTILSNPARTRSLPSIQDAPSLRPVSRSHSPPRITILTNPAREKQRTTQRRSTQSTQSNQTASVADPAPTRVPITGPISILKAPRPAPRILAPALAQAPAADVKLSKPATDAVKEVQRKAQRVKFLFPEIVVHKSTSCEAQANTGVIDPETGTGAGMTNHRQMLDVPDVDSRSRLRRNDLARYYPKEHAVEQMARSKRLAAARRRREWARQRRQTATTASTPTPVVSILSRTRAHASTPIPTGKSFIIPAAGTPMS